MIRVELVSRARQQTGYRVHGDGKSVAFVLPHKWLTLDAGDVAQLWPVVEFSPFRGSFEAAPVVILRKQEGTYVACSPFSGVLWCRLMAPGFLPSRKLSARRPRRAVDFA